MNDTDLNTFSSALIHKALELGASLAGIANVEDLKIAPAFVMRPSVAWQDGIKSVLVIAYSHPEDDPGRDYWLDSKNPPGNIKLISINNKLKDFINAYYPEITAVPLSYHVEKGGVWLKDSAVVAGLGILGKNNLLVTKEFGPRVRLRAMFLSADLPSTGPIDWDPCDGCAMPCRTSCPQNAFEEIVYNLDEYNGLAELPGREGSYSLVSCGRQMKINEENEDKSGVSIPNYGVANSVIKYCRECELNCLAGK